MLFLSLGIREYKSGYVQIHYYSTVLLSTEGEVRTEDGAKSVREMRKMKALTATITHTCTHILTCWKRARKV